MDQSSGQNAALRLRRELHFGRIVACWTERPANLSEMLLAALTGEPDSDALIHGDRRFTYHQFAGAVAATGAALAARGIGAGDRVALLTVNSANMAICLFAIAHLGAIAVPLSPREQRPGITHALSDSGAALVIADEDCVPLLANPQNGRTVVPTVVLGKDLNPVDERGPSSARAAVSVGEDDVAAILYTSGTTGTPKGAMLTGLGLIHSALNYVELMSLLPDDRVAVVAPMSHITGLVAGLFAAVAGRATLLVAPPFKAASFIPWASANHMTVTVMVPAMYNLCLRTPEFAFADLSAWRLGGFGGAPMPAATITALAERLPRLSLMNLYGATETSSPMTSMPPADIAGRRTSVGQPVPGATILVMDADGQEVPRGQTGELWHHGPMVVPGYWQNPAATAKEFTAGFWRSGDIGSMDEDGYVTIHDRLKDMINRGGFKVFAAEVEGKLSEIEGVVEAAVLAKPCPVLGERVHAAITTDGTVSEAMIHAFCAEMLSKQQRPESLTLTTDPLPRNANGKLMKAKLRESLGLLPG